MRLRPAGTGGIEHPPRTRRHVGEPDVLSSNSCGVGGLSRRLLISGCFGYEAEV